MQNRGDRFSTFFSNRKIPMRKSCLTMPLRKSENILEIEQLEIVPHWRQTKLSKRGGKQDKNVDFDPFKLIFRKNITDNKRFRIVFYIEIDI